MLHNNLLQAKISKRNVDTEPRNRAVGKEIVSKRGTEEPQPIEPRYRREREERGRIVTCRSDLRSGKPGRTRFGERSSRLRREACQANGA